MTIKTYPEMDAKLIELLRLNKDNPVVLYAAQRIEELEAEVKQLHYDLQDEQERRDEWEEMYNLAVAEPAPDACLPEHRQATHCGHPREAVRGDVTCCCAMCEEEAQ